MDSNEKYLLRLEIEKKYRAAGIFDVTDFILAIVDKIADGANIDIDGLLVFENRIKNLQDRLGCDLPEDYIKFLKKYSGAAAGYGEWFTIENINFASEFDIVNYQIIEERSDILSEDDLNYMIPIYSENDSYVLLDLRKDSSNKGVFVIWSDEEELAFQSKDFTAFKKKAKAYAKKAETEGDELVECDFFNFDIE